MVVFGQEGKTVVERIPGIDKAKLAAFCKRWKIAELALFGSVLRSDFKDDSDVDVLATFAEDSQWSLLDHVAMEEELSGLLMRKVDLSSRRSVERSTNWIRRQEILRTAETWHAQG